MALQQRQCSNEAGTITTIDIVTGASQGIGRAIAETIGHHRSTTHKMQQQDADSDEQYKLVLVGRNQTRGEQVVTEIQNKFGLSSNQVMFESCDLSSYQQALAMKQRILQTVGTNDNVRVDILVNNAAECPQQQQFVKLPRRNQQQQQVVRESVDKQFASNVLGYHFMVKAFQDLLVKDSSHVVFVASNWAGDLDLKDLNFTRRRYDNDSAYRQSKQCNRMLSAIWAKRLPCVINSCHPGDPCTTLSRSLGYNMYASAPNMTLIQHQTSIPFLCGLTTTPVTTTGRWFDGGNTTTPSRCRFASMEQMGEELFEICESYCV